jgi:hypothetical protein
MANLIINERKTEEHGFFSCNPDGDNLFSVRQGLPVDDAISVASAIMASATETIRSMAEKHDDSELWGALYLLEMVGATMAAASRGLMAESNSDRPS